MVGSAGLYTKDFFHPLHEWSPNPDLSPSTPDPHLATAQTSSPLPSTPCRSREVEI
jgi:hypothetical protein